MKVLIALFTCLFFIPILSCKKGPNDPAISLLTRKSRLDNAWQIASYTYEWKNEIDGNFTSGTAFFNGQIITGTFKNLEDDTLLTFGDNPEQITVNANEFIIHKDGTFSKTWNTTTVLKNDFGVGVSVATTINHEKRSGSWAFLGKELGFYKNKERIVFNTLEMETLSQLTDVITLNSGSVTVNLQDTLKYKLNFFPGEKSETWAIDGLKKEQMTLISELNSTSFFTKVLADSTVEMTESTFTSEMKMELK